MVFEMIWSILARDDLLPRVLVSVRAPLSLMGKEELKDNISVVDWHMPVSLSPTKYAISVRSDDTIHRMIRSSGNFVVNFMSSEHKSILSSCENQDGLFIDLFDFLGVTRIDSDYIDSPRIKEAKEALECEVDHELESGDHTIFIGRVVGPKA